MRKILILIILATMTLVSCNKEEENKIVIYGTPTTLSIGEYIINSPVLTTDVKVTETEFGKYFTDVKAETKGDIVIIKASNAKSDKGLYKSITCIYHLKDGKYESLNIGVQYSIESINAKDEDKIQDILKTQSTIISE